MRMFDWEQYEMGRHKQYADFLEACGHDTRDLLEAMERLQAAAQDLREMGEFYSKQFDEEPFHFALQDLRGVGEFYGKVTKVFACWDEASVKKSEVGEKDRKQFEEPLTPLKVRISAQERIEVLQEHHEAV